MIQAVAKAEAQKLMNDYGKRGIPFLFLIDFEQKAPVVLPLHTIHTEELLYDINGLHNLKGKTASESLHPTFLDKYPIPFAEYEAGFDYVQQELQAGNSYLVNLTYPTTIRTNLPLPSIFHNSRARYRIWWDNHFTVFSPEIFVTIDQQGRIASFPMKGTIDASIPNARQLLLENEKEKAEHATIVDLIRNDLGMVARQVSVDRYRYIETISTGEGSLLQSSSEISGQLGDGFAERLGDIFFRLLPAGSISGAPKQKTIEIIQHAECQARGYYTGVCGLFDGQKVDSGVMIRFVEETKDGLVFRSGGGITARSQAPEEYQELIQKVYLPLIPQPVLPLL